MARHARGATDPDDVVTVAGNAVSVASFYRFHPIDDVAALRERVFATCEAHGLRGTVLLAPEGVNATLAGCRADLHDVIDEHFSGVDVNWSTAAPGNRVFQRLKVGARREIVTFDQPLSPRTPVAEHVPASIWNRLVADPDVVVLDVRNDYESEIGTFRGARRADTANFRGFHEFVARELGDHRQRPIAMFCTGGIRCEKASAYLLAQGFEDVVQLEGGILKYFADTADGDNAFEGECFVFDERVSVASSLIQGNFALCPACNQPASIRFGSHSSAIASVCPGCRDCLDEVHVSQI